MREPFAEAAAEVSGKCSVSPNGWREQTSLRNHCLFYAWVRKEMGKPTYTRRCPGRITSCSRSRSLGGQWEAEPAGILGTVVLAYLSSGGLDRPISLALGSEGFNGPLQY